MKILRKDVLLEVAKSSKSVTSKAKTHKTKKAPRKIATSKAKSSMERFKMEAAKEVGVHLKDGYNGHLTAKQAGSIGGRMVKKMIDSYKNSHR